MPIAREKLFAFIIGFFDGDGCLTKNKKSDSYIFNLVGHYSWLENFEFIFNFLFQYFKIEKTNKNPYIRKVKVKLPQNSFESTHELCMFNITNKKLIKKIKQEVDEMDLPYLNRKLGKVDSS